MKFAIALNGRGNIVNSHVKDVPRGGMGAAFRCVATLMWAVLYVGCEEAEAPESEAREAELESPIAPVDEMPCQIGANHPDVVVSWSDAPSEAGLEQVTESGTIVTTIENVSASPLNVSVQAITNIGGTEVLDLPLTELPASAKVSVEIDLTQTNLSMVALKAPGQILLRVELNPGTENSLIEWSSPVYAHYDANAGTFVVYDEAVLRSKYNNGDLAGEAAAAGGTPGAEIVLSGF